METRLKSLFKNGQFREFCGYFVLMAFGALAPIAFAYWTFSLDTGGRASPSALFAAVAMSIAAGLTIFYSVKFAALGFVITMLTVKKGWEKRNNWGAYLRQSPLVASSIFYPLTVLAITPVIRHFMIRSGFDQGPWTHKKWLVLLCLVAAGVLAVVLFALLLFYSAKLTYLAVKALSARTKSSPLAVAIIFASLAYLASVIVHEVAVSRRENNRQHRFSR